MTRRAWLAGLGSAGVCLLLVRCTSTPEEFTRTVNDLGQVGDCRLYRTKPDGRLVYVVRCPESVGVGIVP